jgi:hypothetical protein
VENSRRGGPRAGFREGCERTGLDDRRLVRRYLKVGPFPVLSEPKGLPTILAEATFAVAPDELNAVELEREQTGRLPVSHCSAK